jgi:hypothetical protein
MPTACVTGDSIYPAIVLKFFPPVTQGNAEQYVSAVMPAKAGIQVFPQSQSVADVWIPAEACPRLRSGAGMTNKSALP